MTEIRTPLADALAEVDRAQAEVRHNWSRGADEAELGALRALAEQARMHLAGCGEACTVPVHAKLMQAVGEWAGKAEAHAARTGAATEQLLGQCTDCGGEDWWLTSEPGEPRRARCACGNRWDLDEPELPAGVDNPGYMGLAGPGGETAVQHAGDAHLAGEPHDRADCPHPHYIAHFTAEAWVDDQAVEVDAQGPREWDCTRFAETRPAYLADMAKAHGTLDSPEGVLDNDDVFFGDPAMPAWAARHRGPFTIRVRREQP